MSFTVLGFVVSTVACGEDKKAALLPTPDVQFDLVKKTDVPLYLEAVSTVDGYVTAEIRARVKGFLRSQDYRDGAVVKAGELLFTIEPDEYVAAVESAKAALTRAKAAKDLADIDYGRVKKLVDEKALPQQQLDTQVARVGDTEGQLNAAHAAVDNAQLNLSYTQVRSPVTGVAGLALVRIGNLVGDSPTLLTTVSQVEPVRVNFPVTEIDYLKQPETLGHLDGRDLKWANAEFAKPDFETNGANLQLVMSDGSIYHHRGVLMAADRNVDPTTGTITMQAVFPNSERQLKPGQFARVRMKRSDLGTGVLVVPQKALTETQGRFSVAVVTADNRIAMKPVDVGPASGSQRIVTSGLSEGDHVVVVGLQRIKDGIEVNAKQTEPAPEPASPTAGSQSAAPTASKQ
ncbi:MAG: efflux RND transporter periplasmic adaptor subunit [Clostridia bacterium]|nr:efflux RND transporter periplasmic adaptor subunit [Deltaproteobacteria bacterium]